eukprot:462563-Alexandrium_andersonii.AAC.1
MSASLVGSEMCIRDRPLPLRSPWAPAPSALRRASTPTPLLVSTSANMWSCLLYTSDAADDM